MGFNRSASMDPVPSPEVLTARMVGIGMNFAAAGDDNADIESTLLQASMAGMDHGDLRVLSLLTTWFGVHHGYVNADRLVRLVAQSSPRVRAYWSAVARWQSKDRRFVRLAYALHFDLLPTGTDFQIKRRGEDARFVGTSLRVPEGTLRDRADDVLTPEVLALRHAGYRNRVLMGPSFRADVWTVLQRTPELPIAEVARRAGCSFATAWQAAQDFRVLGAGTELTR